MKFKTALGASEEGFSVSVPGLPGCWPQGAIVRTRARPSAAPREKIPA